jgi:excisionase family DNA binding protein
LRLDDVNVVKQKVENDLTTFETMIKHDSMEIVAGGYLTVEEAAELIRVHPETVRRWLKAGRLKGSKFGTAWRTTREWIEEFGQASGEPEVPSQSELEKRTAAAMERIQQKYGK